LANVKSFDIGRFRVPSGRQLSLSRFDPADTSPYESRAAARKMLAKSVHHLYALTELLAAQSRWSVLFILQAMDGAGKDSAVKHVMRGLDPKVTQVFAFKAPSAEELRHDFMWRCMKALPERGRIGIFNRSYYEDVLVPRVDPDVLNGYCEDVEPDVLFRQRFDDIRNIERYLSRNGTVIRKIFLNVSRAEQRRRFIERLDDPAKRWKFSTNDLRTRLKWKSYMAAYEAALKATTTDYAPWYVVPADNKWYTHLVVARIAIDALESLQLDRPQLSRKDLRMLRDARRRLRA
jgi:PPK2 family polyphosphate:nucleotide phosphotransferase